jgi:hypothetical protein
MSTTEKRPPTKADADPEQEGAPRAAEPGRPSRSTLTSALWGLALWLALVELGWYLIHELVRAAG